MHPRNILGIVLVILSFGLLYPGITEPIFNLAVAVKVDSNVANIEAKVLNETRSILGTVGDLYDRDRALVATLILLFSVIVPVTKGLMLLGAILLQTKPKIQRWLFQTVDAIGKWSMADVFLVAIFLVYLSTENNVDATRESISFFGMTVPLEIRMLMDSNLGNGFYWFLGYCILSLATIHVIKKPALGEESNQSK